MTKKKDFGFSKNDRAIMSNCLKAGYKVYPQPIERVKKNPLVVLVYQFRNEPPVISKLAPFNQSVLSYRIMMVYRWLWKTKIIEKMTLANQE